MVASIPEYHILGKRVSVERLHLGTIISSIEHVNTLNSGKEPGIEHSRLYCWHDSLSEVTREQSLKGEAGIALKALAIEGAGGEAKIDGERGNIDKYNYQYLDTLGFETEGEEWEWYREYYLQAVKAKGVQMFLESSGYRPVYMITGLKIGRKSSNEFTKLKKKGLGLELGADIGSALSMGPKANGSKTSTTTQKSDGINDACVFAIRVKKLAYRKKNLGGLCGKRTWKDERHDGGAELVGIDRSTKKKQEVQDEFEVEEVGLEDDKEGFKQVVEITEDGKQVIWLVPEDW